MNIPTFKECKKILEEFYKERIRFNIDNIHIMQLGQVNIYENRTYIYFKTFVTLKRINFLIYDFFKQIKPIILYAYSYTSNRKHIKDDFILEQLPGLINFYYEIDNNEYYIKDLEITLTTSYDFVHVDYDFYFYAISNLEENGELTISPIESTHEDTDTDTEEEEEEEPTPEKPKVINLFKIFKSVECIACMDNKPIILFCNCGHRCICEECFKISTSSICPICKTDNDIIRTLE